MTAVRVNSPRALMWKLAIPTALFGTLVLGQLPAMKWHAEWRNAISDYYRGSDEKVIRSKPLGN